MTKVIVTGGRNFNDENFVNKVLNFICPEVIIHGDARGLDTLCKNWAIRNNRQQIPYVADWDNIDKPNAIIRTSSSGKKYNALAGLDRNIEMLNDHHYAYVLSFEGGSGTKHCTDEAIKRKMSVIKVRDFIYLDQDQRILHSNTSSKPTFGYNFSSGNWTFLIGSSNYGPYQTKEQAKEAYLLTKNLEKSL